MPPAVRRRLPWLDESGECLAILRGDRSVEVVDWKGHGERVVASVSERYRHLPEGERSRFALAVMDRFARLTREKSGRLTLPGVLIAQLDRSKRNAVRVVVWDKGLFLWDDGVWEDTKADRLRLLEEEGLI